MSSIAPPLPSPMPSLMPSPLPAGGADQLRRRVLVLGKKAIENPLPQSDLLGEAFQELRAALGCIQALQAELKQSEEALSELRAGLSPAGRREPQPERPASGVPVAEALPAAARSTYRLDLFEEPLATAPAQMESALRARITGALCLGTLAAGDRLPGIRELARRTGLNHKSVRRVYAALEQSGLVEVRDRSGIYVPEPDSPGGEDREAREDREGWIARFLVEAAEHGFGAGELPSLLWQWTAARPLRCACLESTEDDRFALCRELKQRFGLESVPVDAGDEGAAAALQEADLVVTTPFHAAQARAALAPDQPLVVVHLHPRFFETLQRALTEAPCVLICLDPAAGERLRHGVGARLANRIRVLSVESLPQADPFAGCEAGVLTLAAVERLAGGDPPPRLSVPPYLSPRAAHEIAQLLVRLNQAAAR